jgi:hypothetical protein
VFIRLGLERLPGTNTSILRKVVNYGHKKFYNIGPTGKDLINTLNPVACGVDIKLSQFNAPRHAA